MSYSWAKLWIEMIDDRKTASLPDSSWRRFVECILLAMETNRGGVLPAVSDIAWRLRVTPEVMGDDLTRLALAGLVHLNEAGEWVVTNFAKRQAAVPVTERVASHRERKRREKQDENNESETAVQRDGNDDVTPEERDGNEPVTIRSTDKTRLDQNRGEGDKNAREDTPPRPAKVKASPLPPVVKHQSTDRTPAGFQSGNGYHPPDEPIPTPAEPPPDVQAIGEIANALTDVTGISAKLNRQESFEFASELHAAGYTPPQIRAHYSRQKTAGAWNWYESDWRGKKGEPPNYHGIRQTIAGATATASPVKKLSQIDRALAMLSGPQTATG